MADPLVITFVPANQDLVVAYHSELNQFCRPLLRWGLLIFGAFWFFGPIVALPCGLIDFSLGSLLKGIVPFAGGGAILWTMGVNPIRERRRILNAPASQSAVELTLDDGGLAVKIENQSIGHAWPEIKKVVSRRQGFLFHFTNGQAHWLPRHAFKTPEACEEFIKLVRVNSHLD